MPGLNKQCSPHWFQSAPLIFLCTCLDFLNFISGIRIIFKVTKDGPEVCFHQNHRPKLSNSTFKKFSSNSHLINRVLRRYLREFGHDDLKYYEKVTGDHFSSIVSFLI